MRSQIFDQRCGLWKPSYFVDSTKADNSIFFWIGMLIWLNICRAEIIRSGYYIRILVVAPDTMEGNSYLESLE